jgi:hypothetical protein
LLTNSGFCSSGAHDHPELLTDPRNLQLAALSGDVDAHVAVLAQEARSGRDFGEIASVLRDAGRDREAEGWARKGLAAEPLSPWTDALREQLGELISVLLHEDLADEAWSTAADQPDQVSESQWLQLITLREGRRPADVLGPLARLIELGVKQAGDKYRYPAAVKALRRLRDDYERAGDAAGFGVPGRSAGAAETQALVYRQAGRGVRSVRLRGVRTAGPSSRPWRHVPGPGRTG